MLSTHSSREELIDVLRGLAIAGVISVHVAQTTLEGGSTVQSLFSLGKYGVELFFIVSGYLLFKLYGSNRDSLSKSYYLRRITRIYPLWIFFLFLNVTLKIILEKFGYKTYLSNFEHTNAGVIYSLILGATFTLFISSRLWNDVVPGGWSIQSEVAHYLVFPIIRRYKTLFILNFLIVLNIITLIMRSEYRPGQVLSDAGGDSIYIDAWIRLSLFSTVGFFILGGVLYRWLNGVGKAGILTKIKSLPLGLKITGVGYLITFIYLPLPFGKTHEAVIFVTFAIILGLLLNRWLLAQRVMSLIGRYSYFIYFAHFLILDLFKLCMKYTSVENIGFFLFPTTYAFTLFLSLALAVPSMKFIEKPIMNLSR
jgi:exopolysaccharide production protein ExoZ